MSNAKEKVTLGVQDVYIAKIIQDDENGYVADVPYKLAPVMEMKVNPSYSRETLFADNGEDDDLGAEGPAEVEAMFPNIAEDLLAPLIGQKYDPATGTFFDGADPSQAEYFALGFAFTKSNGSKRFRWNYRCKAEPVAEEGVSESDKVQYKPKLLKIKSFKSIYKFDLYGDGSYVRGFRKTGGDEDNANFDGATWFDAVRVPSFGAPSALSLVSVPADGASGIVVSSNLTLTFANALAGGRERGITLINLDTQAPVAVARTINDARTVVTLNPNSNLGASTDYAISVHDIVDVHGQTLTDAVINFTTA